MNTRQHAWQALGALIEQAPQTMAPGALDSRGATTYGKRATQEDQNVYALQSALNYIDKQPLNPPDGAFGKNTQRQLDTLLGFKTYQSAEALPILIALVTKKIASELKHLHQEAPSTHSPLLIEPLPWHYAQADPRWADRALGVGLSMRRAGCAVCCLAMYFNWMGQQQDDHEEITPAVLDEWMDTHGGYAPGTNLLLWSRMPHFAQQRLNEEITHQPIGSKSQPLDHADAVQRAGQIIDQTRRPLLLRVRYRANAYGLWFNHFVLGVGRDEQGQVRFLDPGNAQGGDLNHPQNNTAQTINKGGYDIVAIEHFRGRHEEQTASS